MDSPAVTGQGAVVRDYLAAERTLLAWIRTGLALMGFGFVVARFGLFLQQLQIAQQPSLVKPNGLSLWFGTALIGAGVVLHLFSGWHHLQLIRTMGQGLGTRPHTTSLAVLTSMFLALVGIGITIYLISARDSVHSHFANNKETFMTDNMGDGILNKRSNHTVTETLERLKQTLQGKGITIFAIVDHSSEAEKVGLKMRPTKLVIFGSPKAGTPLMQASPGIAIDLPLKILISEDPDGNVWVSYNSPTYLQKRHGLPQELLPNIAVVETLAAAVAE